MRPVIRVGFLGAGTLNTIQHYPNVASSPDATIYAVCDLNRKLMEERAAPYSPQVMTEDFDEMLADPNVDIVWIAAPPSVQTGLARRSIEGGKNTFVEKPMAETVEECVELGKLAKDKGVLLFTGYNRRFAPAYLDLKSMMDKMEKAPLLTYRLASEFRGRGLAASQRHQLIDEDCHIFDILAFLIGSEPVSVACFSTSHNNDVVLIQYENGAVANVTSSIQSSMSWPKERIEVIMDYAAAAVDDFVELTTANVPGWGNATKRYQGVEFPGWLSGYKERMEKEGLSYVLDRRREWQEIMAEIDRQLEADQLPDEERWKRREELVKAHASHMPPCNYMVDKGWCAADHAILKALRENRPLHAGTAKDAARSIACAQAAIEASKTRRIVQLRPSTWDV